MEGKIELVHSNVSLWQVNTKSNFIFSQLPVPVRLNSVVEQLEGCGVLRVEEYETWPKGKEIDYYVVVDVLRMVILI